VSQPGEELPAVEPADLPESSQRLRLRDDISWNQIDDQIVLLDISGSSYFSVSGAGVTLWRLLVAGTTFEALVEVLGANFALGRGTAEHDVGVFLAELTEGGLLASSAAPLNADGKRD
jgi:hypothetical protein